MIKKFLFLFLLFIISAVGALIINSNKIYKLEDKTRLVLYILTMGCTVMLVFFLFILGIEIMF